MRYFFHLYWLFALLLLANHLYVLWGLSKTEGWGALGWASALQFNYFASAILGLIGIALIVYEHRIVAAKSHKNSRWTSLALANLIALVPFFHLSVMRFL